MHDLAKHFLKRIMDASFDLSSQSGTGVVINDSLVQLNKAWCTETNALEILPFKTEVIEELQAQLIDQQVCAE